MFVYPTENKNEVINLDRVCKIRKSKATTCINFLDEDDHEITSWKYSTIEHVDKAYNRLLQKVKAVRINPDEVL